LNNLICFGLPFSLKEFRLPSNPLSNDALIFLECEISETKKSNLEKAGYLNGLFMMIDTKISKSLVNEIRYYQHQF